MDAGAVADASADIIIEKLKSSPRIKYKSTNTTTDAANASSKVITISCLPLPLKLENLKNSPALNAMNAKAISEMNAEPSITFCGTAFRQNGPMIMPATMYAVTLGNLSNLVSRVIKNPANKIIAIDNITAETGEFACNCS